MSALWASVFLLEPFFIFTGGYAAYLMAYDFLKRNKAHWTLQAYRLLFVVGGLLCIYNVVSTTTIRIVI